MNIQKNGFRKNDLPRNFPKFVSQIKHQAVLGYAFLGKLDEMSMVLIEQIHPSTFVDFSSSLFRSANIFHFPNSTILFQLFNKTISFSRNRFRTICAN